MEAQQPWQQLVTETVTLPEFHRATFGGTLRGNRQSSWVRVVIRPVELRGERHWQFGYFDGKKTITKNFRANEITTPLNELLDLGYAGIHLTTSREEIDIRTTKKGQVQIGRRKVTSSEAVPLAHNRVKDVPLPEGRANRLLEVMGILTRDGHVRPSMRGKYTQINEFLKQLLHCLDDTGLRTLGRDVVILDCGCGSSYLTLALHHYLNDVLQIPARIHGIDVNEDVIRKSVERSQQLTANKLSFTVGRIDTMNVKPDIVVALHACDTATDDAIAMAITREAKLLLSVPCCHHHLNQQLRADGPSEVLRPLFRHSIVQQRTADLITDSFRALTLRMLGYHTDIVEFVSTDHTARNLMIRAVRGAPIGDAMFIKEYQALRQFCGVKPYLESLLGEPFQRLVPTKILPGEPAT